MNIDKLGQWVAIVANVGVLLGFLLVAYQLRLNTTSLEIASRYQGTILSQNAEVALIGDTGYAAMSKAMLNPADMTPDEIMQVWSYFSMANYSVLQAYSDYNQGLISEQDWLNSRNTFIAYINFPVGRAWWETMIGNGADETYAPFFTAVQAGFDQTPANLTQLQFLEMIERIKVLPAPATVDASEQQNGALE